MIDRRLKNCDWRVTNEQGQLYSGSYGGAQLAVLMDIRDELQRLNSLLHCANFTSIPATLRSIHPEDSDAKEKAMIRSFCDCDRDTYGFCPIHDRIALVCKTCETILEDGFGLLDWEAGDDRSVRLQDGCDSCNSEIAGV